MTVGKGGASDTVITSPADTSIGIALEAGTQAWAALTMRKMTPIRVSGKNVFYVTSANDLVLGLESAGVFISIDGQVSKLEKGPPDSGGTGFSALRVLN